MVHFHGLTISAVTVQFGCWSSSHNVVVFLAQTPFGEPTWGPNVDEFRKRFDPDKTWGEGPKRLKNLYFTYLVELRALAKAAPYLEQVNPPLPTERSRVFNFV